MKTALLLIAVALSAYASSGASEKLTAAQAKSHIGKSATVCGVVASADYAVRSQRKPTFLNLDEPYPRHIFTAVIWEEDRSKFGQPETLKGRRVCVNGLIEEYQGKPQITLRDASQLRPE